MFKNRIQRILSFVIFAVALLVICLSFITFESALHYLNSLATDGAVDSYTIGLHERLMRIYRLVGGACLALSFFFYFFGDRLYGIISDVFIDTKKYIRHTFFLLNSFIKYEERIHKVLFVFILGVAIIVRFYFINALPVLYDEAFSFIIYGNKPLFILTSYYTYPNNHLLHTIFMHFSYELFGNSVFAIRLPVFVSGMVLLPLVYLFVRRLSNKQVALITMALTAVAKPMILYSVYARGYMIIAVIFILSLIVAQSIISKPERSKWILLSVLTALGIYTVPTYLFAVGGVYVWLAISLWNTISKKYVFIGVILSSLTGVVLSLALYSPIILFSGIKSIVANDYVSYRYQINELMPAVKETFGELYSNFSSVIPLTLLLLLIAGFLMSFFFMPMLVLYIAFALYFLSFILLQRMVPPERAVIFVVPILLAGCSYGLHLLAEGIVKFKMLILFLIISLLMSPVLIIYKVGLVPTHEVADNKNVASWLKDNVHKGDAVLCSFPIDYPIEFYLRMQGQDPAILRTYPETPERYIIIVNREVEGQTVATVFQQTLKVMPSYNLSARLEKSFYNTDIYVIDGL